MNWELRHKLTEYAFNAPQVGQRFTEMYCFWMYVVDVWPDGTVVTREGSAPVMFPDGAERHEYATAEEWRRRFAFESVDGYWVQFVDDRHDVEGWASDPLTEPEPGGEALSLNNETDERAARG